MNFERQDIFAVPVFRGFYPKAEELKNDIVPLFKKIEKEDKNPIRYSANGYTNFRSNGHILALDELKELREWIGNIVAKASGTIALDGNIQYSGSWFSIMRQYSYHEMHNHLPDVWSGVYYVQADEKDAGLTFINKNQESNWPRSPVKELNGYNSPVIKVPVQTGMCIIFPSYLNHKVDQQLEDKERIMIAFNFFVSQNTEEK